MILGNFELAEGMKVLHLCLASFFIDNYSYQENMLPKYHKLMGYDVSVIASLVSFDLNGNGCLLKASNEYVCDDGYKVTRLDYRRPFKSINRILRIYEKMYPSIEKEKPDIIFIHGCQSWDIKQVIKYLKRQQVVKVFIDNHADFINSGTNWFSRNILHRIIWKHCARSIEPFTVKFYGVTPLRCEFLKDVYNISPENIELLVLGADTERIKFNQRTEMRSHIRKTLNISEDDFVLITGGKIDERKNIHLLLQAVNELETEKIKLIVFGTSNDQMRPIIERLSKSGRIFNIGWIDSKNVNDFYLASDLAVFPGTHSVLWEQSVGTGIPGIFKYWKGMDHIDIGGNCRFLYDSNVAEIKKVLEEVFYNKTEYQKMKKSAEEIGIKKFSYSYISRKALQIL
jgi:1,2-diacylglycerol 3-alpha-glucosyltransferase